MRHTQKGYIEGHFKTHIEGLFIYKAHIEGLHMRDTSVVQAHLCSEISDAFCPLENDSSGRVLAAARVRDSEKLRLLVRISSSIYHISCIIYPISYTVYHVSCIMYHV